jgi:hypothetical protein
MNTDNDFEYLVKKKVFENITVKSVTLVRERGFEVSNAYFNHIYNNDS